MKAKIIRTGEIIDVVWDDKMDSWSNCNNRSIFYLNNELSFLKDKEIDWEQRRYEIAKTMMMALEKHNNNVSGFKNPTQQAQYAIECADALIAELKKRR